MELHRRAFSFDALGRLTGQTSESGCYLAADDDTSGRSFSCGNTTSSESLSYDAAGNRTDLGGVPVAFNRYQYFNGNEFYYDADGNVTKKYNPGVYNREFFWGADNRLDLAQLNSWSKMQYEYNAFGQPVKVSAGDPNGMSVHHYLLWDGDQLLAVIDANGQRISDYIYLPGIDQPFAQTLGAYSPSIIKYHQQDELGNVTGTIEGSYPSQTVTYSTWGEPTAEGNWDNVLLWKGLMWEGDPARLYYMRNRWYDPDAGRFMSEDPIGHDGGINLYAFAGNDPVNGSDPSGLECKSARELCVLNNVTITAPGPGCEPGRETSVALCDAARDWTRLFPSLELSSGNSGSETNMAQGYSCTIGVYTAGFVFSKSGAAYSHSLLYPPTLGCSSDTYLYRGPTIGDLSVTIGSRHNRSVSFHFDAKGIQGVSYHTGRDIAVGNWSVSLPLLSLYSASFECAKVGTRCR